MCCLKCLVTVFLIYFGFAACTWIDFFQFADGERCFLRIFSLIAVIKINKLRFAVFEFCDDKAHLESPVTEMYVTDHLVSYISADTFDTLSNDRGTKMSYVERFCYVRSAVVDDDGLWCLCSLDRVFRVCFHFLKIVCKEFLSDSEVDETWFYNLCHRKDLAVLKIYNYIICDHERGFLVSFGSCHCSVALIFA